MLNRKEDGCYYCKRPNVHKHHIYYGAGNRPISEREGFIVYLCPYHHLQCYGGVHGNPTLNAELKQEQQRQYELTHTRDEFIALIGRNYMEV